MKLNVMGHAFQNLAEAQDGLLDPSRVVVDTNILFTALLHLDCIDKHVEAKRKK